jgi:hypothetical protein
MKIVILLILALSAGPANAQVTSGKDVDEVLEWEGDGSKVDLAVAGYVSKPAVK